MLSMQQTDSCIGPGIPALVLEFVMWLSFLCLFWFPFNLNTNKTHPCSEASFVHQSHCSLPVDFITLLSRQNLTVPLLVALVLTAGIRMSNKITKDFLYCTLDCNSYEFRRLLLPTAWSKYRQYFAFFCVH